jgi:hypothetical protein
MVDELDAVAGSRPILPWDSSWRKLGGTFKAFSFLA